MTTLKLTRSGSGSFKPEVGFGSTSRLTTKRQYPTWRRWTTGVLTGASALAILGIVVIAAIA